MLVNPVSICTTIPRYHNRKNTNVEVTRHQNGKIASYSPNNANSVQTVNNFGLSFFPFVSSFLFFF